MARKKRGEVEEGTREKRRGEEEALASEEGK